MLLLQDAGECVVAHSPFFSLSLVPAASFALLNTYYLESGEIIYSFM